MVTQIVHFDPLNKIKIYLEHFNTAKYFFLPTFFFYHFNLSYEEINISSAFFQKGLPIIIVFYRFQSNQKVLFDIFLIRGVTWVEDLMSKCKSQSSFRINSNGRVTFYIPDCIYSLLTPRI